MAEPKTKKTSASVSDFIAAVPNEQRRKDAAAVAKLMGEVTGEKPAMWGPAIVEGAFGRRRIAFVEAPGGIRLEFMEQLAPPEEMP